MQVSELEQVQVSELVLELGRVLVAVHRPRGFQSTGLATTVLSASTQTDWQIHPQEGLL